MYMECYKISNARMFLECSQHISTIHHQHCSHKARNTQRKIYLPESIDNFNKNSAKVKIQIYYNYFTYKRINIFFNTCGYKYLCIFYIYASIHHKVNGICNKLFNPNIKHVINK